MPAGDVYASSVGFTARLIVNLTRNSVSASQKQKTKKKRRNFAQRDRPSRLTVAPVARRCNEKNEEVVTTGAIVSTSSTLIMFRGETIPVVLRANSARQVLPPARKSCEEVTSSQTRLSETRKNTFDSQRDLSTRRIRRRVTK